MKEVNSQDYSIQTENQGYNGEILEYTQIYKQEINLLHKEIKEEIKLTESQKNAIIGKNPGFGRKKIEQIEKYINKYEKDSAEKIVALFTIQPDLDIYGIIKAKEVWGDSINIDKISTILQENKKFPIRALGYVKLARQDETLENTITIIQTIHNKIPNFIFENMEDIQKIFNFTPQETIKAIEDNPKIDFHGIVRMSSLFIEKKSFDECVTMVNTITSKNPYRHFSKEFDGLLSDWGTETIERYERLSIGKLNSKEIVDLLIKTKNQKDQHNILSYVILSYESQKEKLLPEFYKQYLETKGNKELNEKILQIMTAWSTLPDTQNILSETYALFSRRGILTENITSYISDKVFLETIQKAEPNTPFSSVFSIAIAVHRGILNKQYNNTEEALKNILDRRKQFAQKIIAGPGTNIMNISYTETEYTLFDKTYFNDTFNPEGFNTLGKIAGAKIITPPEKEKRGRISKEFALSALNSEPTTLFINGHGGHDAKNNIFLGNDSLSTTDLFNATKKVALTGGIDKLTIHIFACYGYNIAEDFYKKWREDPDLKAKNLLPPTFITSGNKDEESLKVLNETYSYAAGLYMPHKKPTKGNLTGSFFLNSVEPLNFALDGFSSNNDMAIFMPDNSFRKQNHNGEIGQYKNMIPQTKA